MNYPKRLNLHRFTLHMLHVNTRDDNINLFTYYYNIIHIMYRNNIIIIILTAEFYYYTNIR